MKRAIGLVVVFSLALIPPAFAGEWRTWGRDSHIGQSGQSRWSARFKDNSGREYRAKGSTRRTGAWWSSRGSIEQQPKKPTHEERAERFFWSEIVPSYRVGTPQWRKRMRLP